MPLPGAGILLYVSLCLAGPPLASARPNFPPFKIPRYPAAREQTRRLADRRRDARCALARQHRVFRFHGKNHTSSFLTWLSLRVLAELVLPSLGLRAEPVQPRILRSHAVPQGAHQIPAISSGTLRCKHGILDSAEKRLYLLKTLEWCSRPQATFHCSRCGTSSQLSSPVPPVNLSRAGSHFIGCP